jgi:hypothetical protein
VVSPHFFLLAASTSASIWSSSRRGSNRASSADAGGLLDLCQMALSRVRARADAPRAIRLSALRSAPFARAPPKW